MPYNVFHSLLETHLKPTILLHFINFAKCPLVWPDPIILLTHHLQNEHRINYALYQSANV